MADAYEVAHAESLASPARFWARAADDVEWVRRPRAVFDASRASHTVWFPGGMLNTCANAVELHVRAGRGDSPR